MEPRVCNGSLQRPLPPVNSASATTSDVGNTAAVVPASGNGCDGPSAASSGNTGNFSSKKDTIAADEKPAVVTRVVASDTDDGAKEGADGVAGKEETGAIGNGDSDTGQDVRTENDGNNSSSGVSENRFPNDGDDCDIRVANEASKVTETASEDSAGNDPPPSESSAGSNISNAGCNSSGGTNGIVAENKIDPGTNSDSRSDAPNTVSDTAATSISTAVETARSNVISSNVNINQIDDDPACPSLTTSASSNDHRVPGNSVSVVCDNVSVNSSSRNDESSNPVSSNSNSIISTATSNGNKVDCTAVTTSSPKTTCNPLVSNSTNETSNISTGNNVSSENIHRSNATMNSAIVNNSGSLPIASTAAAGNSASMSNVSTISTCSSVIASSGNNVISNSALGNSFNSNSPASTTRVSLSNDVASQECQSIVTAVGSVVTSVSSKSNNSQEICSSISKDNKEVSGNRIQDTGGGHGLTKNNFLVSNSSEQTDKNSDCDRTNKSTLQNINKCDITLETNILNNGNIVSDNNTQSVTIIDNDDKSDDTTLSITENSVSKTNDSVPVTNSITNSERMEEISANNVESMIAANRIPISQTSVEQQNGDTSQAKTKPVPSPLNLDNKTVINQESRVRKMSTDSEPILVIDEEISPQYDTGLTINKTVVVPKVSTPHTVWRSPTPQNDLHVLQNRTNNNVRPYSLPHETVVRSAAYNSMPNANAVSASYSVAANSLKRPYESIANTNPQQQNKILYAQQSNNAQQKCLQQQNIYPANNQQPVIQTSAPQQHLYNTSQHGNVIQHTYTKPQVVYSNQTQVLSQPRNAVIQDQQNSNLPISSSNRNIANSSPITTGRSQINVNQIPAGISNNPQIMNPAREPHLSRVDQHPSTNNYHHNPSVGANYSQMNRVDQTSVNNSQNLYHNSQTVVSQPQTVVNYPHPNRVDRSPVSNAPQSLNHNTQIGVNHPHLSHVSRVDSTLIRSGVNHPQMNVHGNANHVNRVNHSSVVNNNHQTSRTQLGAQHTSRMDYSPVNRTNMSPIGQQYAQHHNNQQQQHQQQQVTVSANAVNSQQILHPQKNRIDQSPQRAVDSQLSAAHYSSQPGVNHLQRSTTQSPHHLAKPIPSPINHPQNLGFNYVPTSAHSNSQIGAHNPKINNPQIYKDPQRMVVEHSQNLGNMMSRPGNNNRSHSSQRVVEVNNNPQTINSQQVSYPQANPVRHPQGREEQLSYSQRPTEIIRDSRTELHSVDPQRQLSNFNHHSQRYGEPVSHSQGGVNQPMVIRKAPSSGGAATELYVEQLARPASLESDRSTPRSLHSQNTVIGSSTNSSRPAYPPQQAQQPPTTATATSHYNHQKPLVSQQQPQQRYASHPQPLQPSYNSAPSQQQQHHKLQQPQYRTKTPEQIVQQHQYHYQQSNQQPSYKAKVDPMVHHLQYHQAYKTKTPEQISQHQQQQQQSSGQTVQYHQQPSPQTVYKPKIVDPVLPAQQQYQHQPSIQAAYKTKTPEQMSQYPQYKIKTPEQTSHQQQTPYNHQQQQASQQYHYQQQQGNKVTGVKTVYPSVVTYHQPPNQQQPQKVVVNNQQPPPQSGAFVKYPQQSMQQYDLQSRKPKTISTKSKPMLPVQQHPPTTPQQMSSAPRFSAPQIQQNQQQRVIVQHQQPVVVQQHSGLLKCNSVTSNTIAMASKRESPLDLSVKTVRTSADSTAKDDSNSNNSDHLQYFQQQQQGSAESFKKYLPRLPSNPRLPMSPGYDARPTNQPQLLSANPTSHKVDFLPKFNVSTLKQGESIAISSRVQEQHQPYQHFVRQHPHQQIQNQHATNNNSIRQHHTNIVSIADQHNLVQPNHVQHRKRLPVVETAQMHQLPGKIPKLDNSTVVNNNRQPLVNNQQHQHQINQRPPHHVANNNPQQHPDYAHYRLPPTSSVFNVDEDRYMNYALTPLLQQSNQQTKQPLQQQQQQLNSKLLQQQQHQQQQGADKRILDLLRSSLESKEAERARLDKELKAIESNRLIMQQEKLKQQELLENNKSTYKLQMPRAVDSIKFETDENQQTPSEQDKLKTQNEDSGIAALLAARIRTKAELKGFTQQTKSTPEIKQVAVVPRKRVFSKTEQDDDCIIIEPTETLNKPAQIPSKGDKFRSSSETSVYDFRDSGSDTEMPVLERQTLDNLRKDRRNSLCNGNIKPPELKVDPELLEENLTVIKTEKSDGEDIWGSICDQFVEELVTGAKKRRGRKKKGDPPLSPKVTVETVTMETPLSDIKVEPLDESADLVNIVKTENKCYELLNVQLKIEPLDEEDIPVNTLARKPIISNRIDTDSDDSDVPLIKVKNSISGDDKSRSNHKRPRIKKLDTSSSDGEDSDVDDAVKNKVTRLRTRKQLNEAKNGTANKENNIKDAKVKESKPKSPSKTNSHNSPSKTGEPKPQRIHYGDGSDFYPGWEEGVYKYKQSLRMPASLISVTRLPHWPRLSTSLPDLDPCPNSPTPSSIVDITECKKVEVRVKRLEESDQDSNSSFNCAISEASSSTIYSSASKMNQMRAKENNNSIVDVLMQKYGTGNKSKCKRKGKISETKLDDPSIPKVIPKTGNEFELLPTPTPNGKSDDSVVYLGTFRKQTITNFRDAFLNNTGGKLGATEEFNPTVFKSRTRTETRVMRQRATIREVFGEDRPASAPPMSRRNEDSEDESKTATTITNISIKKEKEDVQDFEKDVVVISKAEEEKQLVVGPIKKKLKWRSMRRKFSSGFDYIRKKKKIIKVKDDDMKNGDAENKTKLGSSCNNNNTAKVKRKNWFSNPNLESVEDINKEIKGWVMNKGVGETHLHRAARLGYTDVTAYCLETLCSNPSPRDNAGYTPLHEACSRGHLDIARLLLQYGAGVSDSAHSGIRPLHEAAENGYVEIIRLLLSYGADPMLATYSGQTPLSLATDEASIDLLKRHLEDVRAGEEESDHNEDASTGDKKREKAKKKKKTKKINNPHPWVFGGPGILFDNQESGYDVLGSPPQPDSPSHSTQPSIGSSNPLSDEGEFEFEISDQPLPPLYSIKGEPPTDYWVLLQDLSAILKIKSKDTLLKQINPLQPPSTTNQDRAILKEFKMQEFLEKTKCTHLLCAGEKINIRSSKITMVRYGEKVRQLLGIEKCAVGVR